MAAYSASHRHPGAPSLTHHAVERLDCKIMAFELEHNHTYSLGFTAASLRPELARLVAEAFVACQDWGQAKQMVLAGNTLQARSPATAVRLEREFRQRLQTLTVQQIEILAAAPMDSCRAMTWLSVLKHSAFVFDFVSEVLRDKIMALDPIMRPSDYENFVVDQVGAHPELSGLTAGTKVKIRRVVRTMLREAGILDDKDAVLTLRRPVIPPDVLMAILSDNRKWLAGFLVPDEEISTMRG